MHASLSSAFSLHSELSETSRGINLANPLVAGLLSTIVGFLPILIGLLIILLLKGWDSHKRVSLPGLATGILFASFYDLMKETAGLSGSTLRGSIDALNVSLFVMALVGFYLASRGLRDNGSGIGVAYLWAVLGIGFHGLGEGIILGYDFKTGFTILSMPQVLSFTLHKVAEGITVGVVLFSSSRVGLIHTVAVSVIAGIPVALGAILGLSGLPAGTSTVFFAMGAGATLYMITNLIVLDRDRRASFVLAIVTGFLYMYFAGVLHQFE